MFLIGKKGNIIMIKTVKRKVENEEVQAIQFDGTPEGAKEIKEWYSNNCEKHDCEFVISPIDNSPTKAEIICVNERLNKQSTIFKGDWVIHDNSYWIRLSPDLFEEVYIVPK